MEIEERKKKEDIVLEYGNGFEMAVVINLSGCVYRIVEKVCKNLGFFVRKDESYSYNINILDTNIAKSKIRRMKNFQCVNHFAGILKLTKRSNLATIMKPLILKFPSEYRFYPETKNYTETSLIKYNLNWIHKKDKKLRFGTNVKVMERLESTKIPENSILQRYIKNPMLINGRKADLRCFCLVTCLDPLMVYSFLKGFVRICRKDYCLENLSDVSAHITIEKLNMEEEKEVSSPDEYGLYSKGRKRCFGFLEKYLEEKENTPKFEDIMNKIDEVMLKTVLTGYSHLLKHYKEIMVKDYEASKGMFSCFEILGFDIMLDENYVPFVIDVCHSPSLICSLDTENKSYSLETTVFSELIEESIKLLSYESIMKMKDHQEISTFVQVIQGRLRTEKNIKTFRRIFPTKSMVSKYSSILTEVGVDYESRFHKKFFELLENFENDPMIQPVSSSREKEYSGGGKQVMPSLKIDGIVKFDTRGFFALNNPEEPMKEIITSCLIFCYPYNSIVFSSSDGSIRICDLFLDSCIRIETNPHVKCVNQLIEWNETTFLTCSDDTRIFAISILPPYNVLKRFVVSKLPVFHLFKLKDDCFACCNKEGMMVIKWDEKSKLLEEEDFCEESNFQKKVDMKITSRDNRRFVSSAMFESCVYYLNLKQNLIEVFFVDLENCEYWKVFSMENNSDRVYYTTAWRIFVPKITSSEILIFFCEGIFHFCNLGKTKINKEIVKPYSSVDLGALGWEMESNVFFFLDRFILSSSNLAGDITIIDFLEKKVIPGSNEQVNWVDWGNSYGSGKRLNCFYDAFGGEELKLSFVGICGSRVNILSTNITVESGSSFSRVFDFQQFVENYNIESQKKVTKSTLKRINNNYLKEIAKPRVDLLYETSCFQRSEWCVFIGDRNGCGIEYKIFRKKGGKEKSYLLRYVGSFKKGNKDGNGKLYGLVNNENQVIYDGVFSNNTIDISQAIIQILPLIVDLVKKEFFDNFILQPIKKNFTIEAIREIFQQIEAFAERNLMSYIRKAQLIESMVPFEDCIIDLSTKRIKDFSKNRLCLFQSSKSHSKVRILLLSDISTNQDWWKYVGFEFSAKLEKKQNFSKLPFYFGEFENGKRNGYGRIYEPKSKIILFEGEFKDGLENGKGVEYSIFKKSVWKKFEGQYLNGRKSGRGEKYDFKKKMFIQGNWKDGELVEEILRYPFPTFQFSRIQKHLNIFLGQGAFGIIYKIKSSVLPEIKTDEKFLAVKVVVCRKKSEVVLMKKRIKRGMELYSTIDEKKNIVKFHGIFEEAGQNTFGVIMEYCDTSIDKLLGRGCIEKKEKIRYLFEVALGMRALHNENIMHRDLKWGNILLGYDGFIKLTDFDTLKEDELDWKVTSFEMSSMVGTPTYLAPEIIKGKNYGKACDIYSFGIMIYTLFFDLPNPYVSQHQCSCGTKMERIMKNNDLMTHVGGKCNLRPLVDSKKIEEIPKSILDLYYSCIDTEPSSRPNFDEIVELLENEKLKKSCYSVIELHFPRKEIVLVEENIFKKFNMSTLIFWIENIVLKSKCTIKSIKHSKYGIVANSQDLRKIHQNYGEFSPLLEIRVSYIYNILLIRPEMSMLKSWIEKKFYGSKVSRISHNINGDLENDDDLLLIVKKEDHALLEVELIYLELTLNFKTIERNQDTLLLKEPTFEFLKHSIETLSSLELRKVGYREDNGKLREISVDEDIKQLILRRVKNPEFMIKLDIWLFDANEDLNEDENFEFNGMKEKGIVNINIEEDNEKLEFYVKKLEEKDRLIQEQHDKMRKLDEVIVQLRLELRKAKEEYEGEADYITLSV